MQRYILIPRAKTIISLLVIGEVATALYIGGVAQLAVLTGVAYVLFPELAALAYDVFTRPHGTWAKAPVMLVVTPFLTAVAGILIEQNVAYGFLSVLLAVAVALLIIKTLDSPVAPAISAGLLPVALGEGSWWYPVSILFGTGFLVASLLLFRKMFSETIDVSTDWTGSTESDEIERPPRQYAWLPFFLVFLLASIWLVKITGIRFILFPPLVVIGFEMFSHSEICPWADRPIHLPLICMFTAFSGVLINMALGGGPLAAILMVAIGVGVCRIFKLHIPPAIAVGLLPFVMANPDFSFPLAVGGGTVLLSAIFISYRFLSYRTDISRK